ncbi:MAG TPA: hypothetical protein VLM89_00245 [Phycisphaerae bacterium]|nr:hypothetical protein [Phycisphaerae bacterium]
MVAAKGRFDGEVISGLGIYNGQARGWVATLNRQGPVGACCRADLTCYESTLPECTGVYKPGETCATAVCCPTPFADNDQDTDVDQADFGTFQVCYTGSTTGVPSGCACFDRNSDNKVDGSDYTQFNNCFTGGNVPWSQGLTPLCQP